MDIFLGELDESIRTAGSEETATDDVASGTSAAWSLSGSAKAAASWVSSAASVTTSLASVLLPKQLKSSPREESPSEGNASGVEVEPNSLLTGAESDGHSELASQQRLEICGLSYFTA